MLIALPVLLHQAGGWSGFHAALPPVALHGPLGDDTVMQALELFLPTCLLMLGNQAMYQKFFSAQVGEGRAGAVVGWVMGTVVLETVIVAHGGGGARARVSQSQVSPFPREIIAVLRRGTACRG